METKKAIRDKIKQKRAALSLEEQQAKSHQIFCALTSHPLYKSAEDIYCYVSFDGEVDTKNLVESSLKMGKKVAVPKILVNNVMEFYYINSTRELTEGHYGILEPRPVNKAPGICALVVMPGVAFDKSGGRIGYGKGYYDAYLKHHPSLRRIALAFEFQCMESLPREEHDVAPEFLVTEKGIYPCLQDFLPDKL